MKNPYEVLGIPSNASLEQIKQAYRDMAKKYHPDNYANSPLAGRAAKKMEEINEAYDTIIMTRGSSPDSGAKENGAWKTYHAPNQSYSYNGNPMSDLNDIRVKINQGRIDDAEMLLDGIPAQRRTAEWYFLKGSIQNRRGWFEEARKNFTVACQMEPGNQEYKAAFDNMNRSSAGGYRTERRTRNGNGGCSTCDICSGLLCADCCCECMGGDFISCC